jgi:CHAT domain-containing protein/tetratricopeptide (TPR) repeat protein
MLSLLRSSVLYLFIAAACISIGMGQNVSADILKADSFLLAGNNQEALSLYLQASRHDKAKDSAQLVYVLNKIGETQTNLGNIAEAKKAFESAVNTFADSPWNDSLSISYGYLGYFAQIESDLELALAYNYKALSIARKWQQNNNIIPLLNNIGLIHSQRGSFIEASAALDECLQLAEKNGTDSISLTLMINNLGLLYNQMGQYNKAIEYFTKALLMHQHLSSPKNKILVLMNLSLSLASIEDFSTAMVYLRMAEKLSIETNSIAMHSRVLNNIGLTYYKQFQFDSAVYYYKESLRIGDTIIKPEARSAAFINLGSICATKGDTSGALKYFQDALLIDSLIGNLPDMARVLNHIARMTKDGEAEYYYNRAIELKEKVRLTAQPELRREYLASQQFTYGELASFYARNNNIEATFLTIEKSRSRVLAEQIAGSDSVMPISLQNFQHSLNAETGALSYFFAGGGDLIVLGINKDTVLLKIINDTAINKAIHSNFSPEIESLINQEIEKTYGQKIDSIMLPFIEARRARMKKDLTFPLMLYRSMLSNTEESCCALGEELFRLLIGDLPEVLGARHIIVIPDGALGLIPFETLCHTPDKYFIESYDISYVSSATVCNLIGKRQYPPNRKPIAIFAGAEYIHSDNTDEAVSLTDSRIQYLASLSAKKQNKQEPLTQIYQALGYGDWVSLPGTIQEAIDIQTLHPDADMNIGRKASETFVKMQSETQKLSQYKIIHFATHGLSVSEIPSLSALVLSQSDNSFEDNYLTINEIEKLHLKADMVCLSACETGIGKFFKGEGIAGLSSAFIAAGANAVVASLWQVSDESTAFFMKVFYQNMQNNSTINSLRKTKLVLLQHEDFRHPYYWGAFVYYGQ